MGKRLNGRVVFEEEGMDFFPMWFPFLKPLKGRDG